MSYEVWDRTTDACLGRFRDEAEARTYIAGRLEEGGNPRWATLERLDVKLRVEDGTTRQVCSRLGFGLWVALGSELRPDETTTVTEPATEDHLAYLQRRHVSITIETMQLAIGYAIGLSLILGLIGVGVIANSVTAGLVAALLIAVIILGIGFAISWAKRETLRVDARHGTVTIKRGPFVVVGLPARTPNGGASTFSACFADGRIEVSEAVAWPLLQLGPILSATVVLFPRSGQIVEVRGADDVVLFRNPDYWPTSFRPSVDADPTLKEASSPDG